jgi:peptidase E
MVRARLMAMPGSGLARLRSSIADLLVDAGGREVGYVPGAALTTDFYLAENRAALADIADVRLLDLASPDRASLLSALVEVDLLYVPGGNTFVLLSRLRECGLAGPLRERLAGGMPYVGFSAGAVLLGSDILNSMDVNAPAVTDPAGLGVLPFSLNVHYPADEEDRPGRDERIAFYHLYRRTPVLALEDDALLALEGGRAVLTEGRAWVFDGSGSKVPLETGDKLTLARGPVTPERAADATAAIRAATALAEAEPSVRAVALVGSWARGAARADSDLDLVVLADQAEGLLARSDWLGAFGSAGLVGGRDFGAVRERRLRLPSGFEIEVCVGAPSWADVPADPGTARIALDGLVPLYDPNGILRRLLDALSDPAAVPVPPNGEG